MTSIDPASKFWLIVMGMANSGRREQRQKVGHSIDTIFCGFSMFPQSLS